MLSRDTVPKSPDDNNILSDEFRGTEVIQLAGVDRIKFGEYHHSYERQFVERIGQS